MKSWQVTVVRALVIALYVMPVLLALVTPDGYVWGGGKGKPH